MDLPKLWKSCTPLENCTTRLHTNSPAINTESTITSISFDNTSSGHSERLHTNTRHSTSGTTEISLKNYQRCGRTKIPRPKDNTDYKFREGTAIYQRSAAVNRQTKQSKPDAHAANTAQICMTVKSC